MQPVRVPLWYNAYVREEAGIACNTFINQSKTEGCILLFFSVAYCP